MDRAALGGALLNLTIDSVACLSNNALTLLQNAARIKSTVNGWYVLFLVLRRDGQNRFRLQWIAVLVDETTGGAPLVRAALNLNIEAILALEK